MPLKFIKLNIFLYKKFIKPEKNKCKGILVILDVFNRSALTVLKARDHICNRRTIGEENQKLD